MLIEALSLGAACREALDEEAHPWSEDAEEGFDMAGPVIVTRAVELPDQSLFGFRGNEEPNPVWLGNSLYRPGLDPLPIPVEFADRP